MNMHRTIKGWFFTMIAAAGFSAATAQAQSHLSDYIRPMVGTKGEEGNTYPGPSAPFGMVQISPDTDTTNWNTDSG